MAADTGHHLAGTQLAHRYQLTEPLARGGLCDVFRGDDLVLRRPIAVKVIPPDLAGAYRAALRQTSALSHPAAIAVYDAVEQDGRWYLVQEYVPGRPLSVYIETGVPVERALVLVGQLARAIGYAHAQGIIHGDLTPAAVLVDRQAMVRINNFALPPDASYVAGVARQIAASAQAAAVPSGPTTPPAEATPAESPEASAERRVDEPSVATIPEGAEGDVWAIGALLWQLLTSAEGAGGERRFRGDVPELARELVRQCVYAPPGERIGSAVLLAERVEAVAEELRRLRPASTPLTPPALRAAREAVAGLDLWSDEEPAFAAPVRGWAGAPYERMPRAADPRPAAAPSEFSAPTDPALDELTATRPARHFGDTPAGHPQDPARFSPPGDLSDAAAPMAYPTIPSVPRWEVPAPARGAATSGQRRGIGLPTVIVLGVILFVIFFVIGYLAPSLFAH